MYLCLLMMNSHDGFKYSYLCSKGKGQVTSKGGEAFLFCSCQQIMFGNGSKMRIGQIMGELMFSNLIGLLFKFQFSGHSLSNQLIELFYFLIVIVKDSYYIKILMVLDD